MDLPQKIKKDRLVFGLYLLVLIVAIELLLHHFHLPGWPLFMVMVFFFEAHMDKNKAPHLILGALTGVVCFMLTVQFIEYTAATLGVPTARLIFICIVVYAIVALGEVLPKVFNNYAFMFYLVSGLASMVEGSTATPWLWMGQILVGGVLVILAILGLRILVALSMGLKIE